ncbi:MAG: monothiol glutaredoxin, Grx4 family [Gammaproteobacteria bacterium]|nr:monothiol glutaredoxin, Grx4 family [Gammaproteobacteria bacterium]|tara:strand:+ start:389 stop:703 length:315 start_codon:yes stop_codon:yes gene_type:complete
MSALDKIKKQVADNPVMLYMKGTPEMPMCGFSSKTVEALKQCGKSFAYCNVILDQEVMRDLPSFKDWPTFPQLYIKGELIGGCDITLELFESGELKKLIDSAVE